jgi:hypothetical protein
MPHELTNITKPNYPANDLLAWECSCGESGNSIFKSKAEAEADWDTHRATTPVPGITIPTTTKPTRQADH